MKTGIELIAEERQEQIEKHGYTVEKDKINNEYDQLIKAAMELMQDADPKEMMKPYNWDSNYWEHLCHKPLEERLVIAGALIAAEIDRIQ